MIKIKLQEIHKKNKEVRTFAGKINGKGFCIELDRSLGLDKRTIKNWAKNWIFENMEVML